MPDDDESLFNRRGGKKPPPEGFSNDQIKRSRSKREVEMIEQTTTYQAKTKEEVATLLESSDPIIIKGSDVERAEEMDFIVGDLNS